MTRYRITHVTAYLYEGLVSLCHNEARFTPLRLPWQECVSTEFITAPGPTIIRDRTDLFGNQVRYFAVQEPHEKLIITVTSEVHVSARPRVVDTASSPAWEEVRDGLGQYLEGPGFEARTFTLPSPLIPIESDFAAFARPSFPSKRPILEGVEDLMNRIYNEFTFVSGFTTIATPLTEVLVHKRGVCQDFSQLMIACLRSLGLAARYVSGYLETMPPPGEERLVGADASHAWLDVYDPDGGWQPFDPTNNLRPGEKHVILGVGRDFSDVTPLKGIMIGSGQHELELTVDVLPLGSDDM